MLKSSILKHKKLLETNMVISQHFILKVLITSLWPVRLQLAIILLKCLAVGWFFQHLSDGSLVIVHQEFYSSKYRSQKKSS
jgi:hypothetical protein